MKLSVPSTWAFSLAILALLLVGDSQSQFSTTPRISAPIAPTPGSSDLSTTTMFITPGQTSSTASLQVTPSPSSQSSPSSATGNPGSVSTTVTVPANPSSSSLSNLSTASRSSTSTTSSSPSPQPSTSSGASSNSSPKSPRSVTGGSNQVVLILVTGLCLLAGVTYFLDELLELLV
ncbi:hypothetical protein IE53DRAFT_387181 [Violaceomyces palustris]|uniref:Uncharacterized protein n=1 Tax=Violaceomyces palustris TaxID=1673888 RepID=A0ACD0NXJ1_9BASI|nr:hypothetical protein IE53DRAFT_387181 [Violaceomyces palustris]